ncbi:MAG: response regulator [Cyanobacteria bacterium REEB67]|nr:response regulator [Cyanobacteria bacterium REEB67]
MTKKILVVDDESLCRSATSLAMQMIGYRVDQAANGLDALKRFISEQYDVILMDCDMPILNGIECTQKIREYETGTASRAVIIALTGSLAEDIEERCLRSGMDAYLNKSCSTEELQQVVQKWLVPL